MDKEVFLKSKLKRIAYNYSINIESPVVFKEIMAELSDIYYKGFNEGYDQGYDQGYDDGCRDWIF